MQGPGATLPSLLGARGIKVHISFSEVSDPAPSHSRHGEYLENTMNNSALLTSADAPSTAPAATTSHAADPVFTRHNLLSRAEAADYLGVKPQTLSAWACNRRVALPLVRVGRRVMYRLIDLEAFCANNIEGLVDGGGAK